LHYLSQTRISKQKLKLCVLKKTEERKKDREVYAYC
jgi:hypothetical protein